MGCISLLPYSGFPLQHNAAESVAESRSPGPGGSSTLEALPYDFGLCAQISLTNAAESGAESQSGVERCSPEQGGCSTLEALPYDLLLCERVSLTHFSESVAQSRSPGQGVSSMLEALRLRLWILRPTLFDRLYRVSGRESVSQWQRVSQSVASSQSPEQGGCSTLDTLPYDFGLCGQVSLTHFAELVAGSRWQGVGRLGSGEAARWKLSLLILDSATESL